MRRAIVAGLIAAALSGGLAYANPTTQGVQVPTLGEHLALEGRVADLESRVAALEAAPPSTTTTTTTTTVPPTTTTTVPPTVDATLLPTNGVVPCDNCVVEGLPGHTYPRVDANGRVNVVLRNISVDGSLGDSGPLQSGTVNIRDASNVDVFNVSVRNSPRSCFSLERSTGVTLDTVLCDGAVHLGIHGGFVTDIVIVNSELTDFSQRNTDLGWESGGMKLAIARNVRIEGNHVHHGNGPGIWIDIHADGVEILDNNVHDTTGEGIFFEISENAKIEGNTVARAPNGLTMSRMNWCYGAGILVSTSFGVEVLGNVVEGSVHGIIFLDQSWRNDTPSGYTPSAYLVEGNTVRNVNKVGACEDVRRDGIYAGVWRNNTFENVQSFLRPL